MDDAVYLENLRQVQLATENGKMKWDRLNQTTFAWTTNAPQRAKIIVQKVSNGSSGPLLSRSGPPGVVYTFRVYEGDSELPKINLTSNRSGEVGASVKDFYFFLVNRFEQEAVDFLKSIIPPAT